MGVYYFTFCSIPIPLFYVKYVLFSLLVEEICKFEFLCHNDFYINCSLILYIIIQAEINQFMKAFQRICKKTPKSNSIVVDHVKKPHSCR